MIFLEKCLLFSIKGEIVEIVDHEPVRLPFILFATKEAGLISSQARKSMFITALGESLDCVLFVKVALKCSIASS